MNHSFGKFIQRTERITGVIFSIGVLFLLWLRATHAGAIWRDEVNSVQFAVMPTLRDIWRHLAFDSFPIAFNLILRAYVDLFGTSDAMLRAFGVAVGVLMLAAAWWNARASGEGVPLLFLAIVGTNATWLVSGMAPRGYGIGAVTILITFALAVNVVKRPNRKSFLVFAIAGLVAVQLVYLNIALLAAISTGMVAVFLVQRRFDLAVTVSSIFAIWLISWTPYLLMQASLEWRIVLTAPANMSISEMWIKFGTAVGNSTIPLALVWFALVLALLFAATRRIVLSWRQDSNLSVMHLLFFVTTALAALVIQYFFLRTVGYSPQPRYFLGLFVIMTATAELVLGIFAQLGAVRVMRWALAVGIFLISSITAWPKLTQHSTNIDIVARTLEQNAGPDDLVVIDRETVGVSFNWHYRGKTRWETVPILNDHRLHRDDLMKAKMMEQEPNRVLEDEIANSLRAGNRVWLVHDVKESNRNLPATPLAPAPDPRVGWNEWAYREAWARDMRVFLENHSTSMRVTLPPLPNDGALENEAVFLAQGWRD